MKEGGGSCPSQGTARRLPIRLPPMGPETRRDSRALLPGLDETRFIWTVYKFLLF